MLESPVRTAEVGSSDGSPRPRKVLVVNYRYFVSGGPERYLFNLSDLLESKGHEVVPFSIAYERNEPTPHAKYFASPLSDPSSVYFKEDRRDARSVLRTLERTFYSPEVYRNLSALIEAERPDAAIVLHYLRKLSPAVLTCLHDHGIPFVVRLSDFAMICPSALLLRDGRTCESCVGGSLLHSVRHRCVQGSLAASAINLAATAFHRRAGYFDLIPAFVAPSRFTLEKMVEGGWDRDRLVHVPTFVEAAEPAATAERRPSIVYVGRLERLKGVHVLLDAARRLRDRGIDPFAVSIVGSGDDAYVEELRAHVREHALDDVVRFEGALEAGEVRAALRSATCSVAPSLCYDNMPNAVLESLAEATPVVASAHGSFPEIVTPETGLLVPPDDAGALADALERLLRDPAQAAELGAAGARFVRRHHSPERHYDVLMETLRRVRQQQSQTTDRREEPAWT